MPSILHVSQPTDYGVARCVRDLAADQTGRGWDVTVACPTDGGLAAELDEAGVRRVDWPAVRSPQSGFVRERRALGTIVEATQPQVVHLHSSKAGLSGRALIRGRRPTVFQPHAWSFAAVSGPERVAALGWERLAARWSHLTVCCSEGEETEGRAAGIRSSWRVVRNSVDLDHFVVASDADRLARRAELLPQVAVDAPVAVNVGRLSRQKGQDLLVAAWPEVRRRVPGAAVVLVGGGPEESALRAAAGEGVHFAGEQNDVRPWLAAADLVVQPSRYEGMSIGLLEAMASGRAVVATDAAGMREALGDGPDAAGVVVPVDDVSALATAVAERLSDRARCAIEGGEGRRRAEQRHDRRQWLDAFAEIAMELAAPR